MPNDKKRKKRRRRLRPWVKYALAIIAATFFGLLVSRFVSGCRHSSELFGSDDINEIQTDAIIWDRMEHVSLPSLEGFPETKGANVRIPVRNVGDFAVVFNDSNYRQYAVAEKLGIDPVDNLEKAYHNRRPLVHIESNEFYQVDDLTHSMPYLVPEAALLLKEIGRNFIDSVGRRGGRGQKIIVTSLLRTPQSVKRLRRVNRNATDSSTHKFGTTFDISYYRFAARDSLNTVHDGDLKNILAEVLADLKKQNRCLVKYERHTACFHITAMPVNP